MNKELEIRNKTKQRGFTLMEIMVSATIFVIIVGGLLSLFNYVLKINRRSEALRQASQGMRSFVEFLVKEVRNGQIDYYVNSGTLESAISSTSPCQPPAAVGDSTYQAQDNKLGIINTNNNQECFYFGNDDGSYINTVGQVGNLTFATSTGADLVLQESGINTPQLLNPPNMKVENLMFYIRPLCDPYTPNCQAYSNGFPRVQPFVTILMKFVVKLPTGEQVPIYYQTTVSSQKYDIPQ